MRVFKKILLVGSASLVLLIIVTGLWIYLCPVDSRLNGTFRSDREATVKNLSSQDWSDWNIYVFNQIYGNSHYVFEGHRATFNIKAHTIHGYPRLPSGSSTTVADETHKFFFFRTRKLDKDRILVLSVPQKFWQMDSIALIKIRFTSDGFWLGNTDSYRGLMEKFTRIKS